MEITTNLLSNFLIQRRWTLSKSESHIMFGPPAELNLPGSYTLYIRNEIRDVDRESYVHHLLSNLSAIYQINVMELEKMILNSSTIFSVRVYDSQENNLKLVTFERLLKNVSKLIKDTASFVLTTQPKLEEEIYESNEYLSRCNFLRTEKGSFIAKIELPSNDILRQKGLFNEEVLDLDVGIKLQKTISFVKKQIFDYNQNIDIRSIITENKELINLDVLEDIKDLYLDTGIENIDYTFNFLGKDSTISTQNFNETRIESLNSFIEVIREELEDKIYSISLNNGTIYGLSSKDPFEDKNKIRVTGIVKGFSEPATVVLKLDSDVYSKAIVAHKDRKLIELSGKAVKRKREYHIQELESISFGD